MSLVPIIGPMCRAISLILSFLYLAQCSTVQHSHRSLPHVAEDITKLTERQRPSTIPVTGVPSTSGIHPRLEIRQLQQNSDQWNLYLLGLRKLQAVNQSDPLSYYQIAGIHGVPFIPWDNVQAAPGQSFNGYCAHSSTLFLTWHRPYLALFEQVLYGKVTEAANEFPNGPLRQRYYQAAVSFRVPYWDWAAVPPDGGPTMPDSVTSPTVNVTVPSGDNVTTTTIQISNPLYSYAFHPLVPSHFYYSSDYEQFTLYPETLRAPTTQDASATSNDAYVASILDGARSTTQERLYNLMTSSREYPYFSTEMWHNENKTWPFDSLESIHDLIHNDVGMFGHMNYIVFSAFDPVFWLHHVMIDRLFAMWQVMNPNSFIEPAAQMSPTFTYAINTIEDGDSPLTPFHTDNTGDFWTSFNVSSVYTFNYNYPELWNTTTNASASISDVRASVNSLYGNSGVTSSVSSTSQHFTDVAKRDVSGLPMSKEASIVNATTKTGARRQYIATIQAQKNGLGDSFSVYIFIGSFDEKESSHWRFEPNFVGTHGFFANPGFINYGTPLTGSGTVPLTNALVSRVEKGELTGLGPNEVSIYLKRNLKWRIMKADGCVVPAGDVPGLKISIISADAEPPLAHDRFPVWGSFISYPEITAGMAGGACS